MTDWDTAKVDYPAWYLHFPVCNWQLEVLDNNSLGGENHGPSYEQPDRKNQDCAR